MTRLARRPAADVRARWRIPAGAAMGVLLGVGLVSTSSRLAGAGTAAAPARLALLPRPPSPALPVGEPAPGAPVPGTPVPGAPGSGAPAPGGPGVSGANSGSPVPGGVPATGAKSGCPPPPPDSAALDDLLAHGWARALYEKNRPRVLGTQSTGEYVALTFDDGPKPYGTPAILSVLEQYHAHVTFFLVGKQAMKYPAIVSRIAADGDEIGNHTFDHYRLPTIPLDHVVDELERNRAAIRRLTGQTMFLFRPPGGRTNPQIQTVADSLGYTTVFWRVDSGELQPDMTPDRVYRRIIDNVKSGDVVLLHNGDANIVAALPRILENLSRRGFMFVTVSQLMQLNGGQVGETAPDPGVSDVE